VRNRAGGCQGGVPQPRLSHGNPPRILLAHGLTVHTWTTLLNLNHEARSQLEPARQTTKPNISNLILSTSLYLCSIRIFNSHLSTNAAHRQFAAHCTFDLQFPPRHFSLQHIHSEIEYTASIQRTSIVDWHNIPTSVKLLQCMGSEFKPVHICNISRFKSQLFTTGHKNSDT
jgi:hypothetical protein